MEILWDFIWGLLTGCLIVILIKSIYLPKARQIQAIMLFDQLHTIIANVEGKKIYKGKSNDEYIKWDLIDLRLNEKQELNIYFFLWPFFSLYTYPFTYTKAKKIGDEQYEDIVIYKNEKTRECIVSKTGVSNYLEFRTEYPTVTPILNTKELASVVIYINNIIEVENAQMALFSINNYLQASTEILNGALRGLVAERNLYDLNQFSSEGGNSKFNKTIKDMVNTRDDIHPGIRNFGLKVFKSVFKDLCPADDKTKELMRSYTNITIAQKTAEAYVIEQEPIVEWRKKYLVDTGLAKVDSQGNIIELVPDANIKIGADAIKELAKLTGTLVIDSGILNKMFNIKSFKK